ncbi:MAG TPA: diaminobutyrate--2-oxoglutarate transaminase, partial [Alcanivorax sp.]|nr:diaminobutyrate--2-oxoglutarate transaminase [Alcanivorax sp.]
FFSFDNVGIKPDIITLSKSLSGYGLPLAVVLLKPELDQWKPGEHNGTFRGHNLAFATAAKALEHFWSDDTFAKEVQKKGDLITDRFRDIASGYDDHWFYLNGRGMMQGLVCRDGEMAEEITKAAFKRKLVIETSGADDQVIKTLCPLTVTEDEINHAMDVLKESVEEVMKDRIKRGDANSVSSLAG